MTALGITCVVLAALFVFATSMAAMWRKDAIKWHEAFENESYKRDNADRAKERAEEHLKKITKAVNQQ